MRRDGTPQRAWRRQVGNPTTRADEVLRKLRERELASIDVCQMVWEEEGDPLAVCEAVRQSRLPEWLESALLVLLTDGEGGYPSLRRRLWRDRTKQALDGARAAYIARLRVSPYLPQTWETALAVVNLELRDRYADVPSLSASGSKRSYERVCRGLVHRSRYFRGKPGLARVINDAWKHVLSTIEKALHKK